MKLEQVRPGVLRITAHAIELGGLMAAVRWAVNGAPGQLPTEAQARLQQLVQSYDAELARLDSRASSANREDRQMAYAIATSRVEDFDRFRETFTTRGAAKRREHGSRGAKVFRNADDPHEVIAVFDWNRSGVDAFMADPEVQEVMRAAGLEAPPTFTFAEEALEHEV